MDYSKRLSVLSIQEQKAIYQIPDFTKEERVLFFSLNSAEKDIVQSVLRGLSSKVFFILQLGYFRSLYQFFIFEFSDVQKDVAYILQAYFPDKSHHDLGIAVNKKTRLYHRKIIQTLYSYQSVDIEISQKLLKKSESLLLKDYNPKYIFKELHTYLNKNKIILPSYSTIQNLISRAIINHERRIARVIQEETDSCFKNKLDTLLNKESEHRYYLTLIKAPQNRIAFLEHKLSRSERRERCSMTCI